MTARFNIQQSNEGDVPMLTDYDYHKLQSFSGKVPTFSGEDDFDTWIDKAIPAVEEWDVADVVKRQRVVESLQAPALDVIRNMDSRKSVIGC